VRVVKDKGYIIICFRFIDSPYLLYIYFFPQDFQVLNLMGRGGFACVYRARAVKTGEEVAIKMIDKKLMKSTGMIERVRREVEIHSR